MKSYRSVMYALDLSRSEFWLGEVDDNGVITGFTDFILDHKVPHTISGYEMFYYVDVMEDEGHLEAQIIQWYAASPKTGQRESITSLAERGILNPIESANKIMDLHRKISTRLN